MACATTGKAAVPLNGTTLHSAFSLSLMKSKTTKLKNSHLFAFRNAFVGIKCIIIDEISMLSCFNLEQINLRLQEITGAYDKPFGGFSIILCGDFRQLPPVCASPCFLAGSNFGGCPILWQSLDYFPLRKVVRQNDVSFSNMLTRIGKGLALDDDAIKLIQSRYRSAAWCDENLPNAVRLFNRNEDVDAYNIRPIKNGISKTADDEIIGHKSKEELSSIRRKLHSLKVSESQNLPYFLKLALGYPYKVSINLDVTDGIVNGTIGVLRHIEVCLYVPN